VKGGKGRGRKERQMSYFEAKMHQIRFPLGLCPRPHWVLYLIGLLLRGWRRKGTGAEGKGKGRSGRKGEEERAGEKCEA